MILYYYRNLFIYFTNRYMYSLRMNTEPWAGHDGFITPNGFSSLSFFLFYPIYIVIESKQNPINMWIGINSINKTFFSVSPDALCYCSILFVICTVIGQRWKTDRKTQITFEQTIVMIMVKEKEKKKRKLISLIRNRHVNSSAMWFDWKIHWRWTSAERKIEKNVLWKPKWKEKEMMKIEKHIIMHMAYWFNKCFLGEKCTK